MSSSQYCIQSSHVVMSHVVISCSHIACSHLMQSYRMQSSHVVTSHVVTSCSHIACSHLMQSCVSFRFIVMCASFALCVRHLQSRAQGTYYCLDCRPGSPFSQENIVRILLLQMCQSLKQRKCFFLTYRQEYIVKRLLYLVCRPGKQQSKKYYTPLWSYVHYLPYVCHLFPYASHLP